MSYFLTEEQELIRESVREMAVNEIRPRVMEIYDVEKHEQFIRDMQKRFGELGVLGIIAPEVVGGSEMSLSALLAVQEEVAKECPELALHLMLQCAYTPALMLMPEVGMKWCPKVFSGEAIFAGTMTDPAGAMNHGEWSEGVVKVGDEFIINTTKNFCTAGDIADVLFVYVQYQGSMMGLVVEKDTPGVELSLDPTCGLTAGFTNISFTDVHVPESWTCDMSWWSKDGVPVMGTVGGPASTLTASVCNLGLMEGLFDRTVEHCKSRTIQGKPMIERSDIQAKLARIKVKIEALRAVLYDAARLSEEGKPNMELVHCAKVMANDLGAPVCYELVTLFGGLGFAVETGVERYYRDTLGLAIADCTTDMHLSSLAAQMGFPGAVNAAF
ncbi:acyl-CoA dehydrogenase family protein [Adlercreutzia sp. ZJ141]|uniref:acyl-CoA dehydrogenase family protein n=1 Tax=Adlercreutzia sp. ZJ141 TaxID=2709406 RepID=UPI0013EC1ED8|nr:acyl-CoA dehydrogenase family protein [Adlercreutzia sp. ZJ141]